MFRYLVVMLLLHMLLTWSELLVSDLKEVARSIVTKVLISRSQQFQSTDECLWL